MKCHALKSTGFGMLGQPDSDGNTLYARRTKSGRKGDVDDSRKVLWQSVSALMTKHYGKENLTRLAHDCGIGPASASRLKEGKTSIGLELVDRIAKHFKVDPWQLLVPNFAPDNPPALQPMSETERRLYERLREVAKELKENT